MNALTGLVCWKPLCNSNTFSGFSLNFTLGSNIGKVWATATHKDRGTGLLCAVSIIL